MATHFLTEFLRAPNRVGAIAPSSRHLAKVMVDHAGVAKADSIVELGPGTGAFTEMILSKKKPDAEFFALEYNAQFAVLLRERFRGVSILEGCASQLREHIPSEKVCSIVSGLPWAVFDSVMQKTILDEVFGLLGDHGTFATFAYYGPHWLPAGRGFHSLLQSHFRTVRTSPIVIRNLPPAFVYFCSK